MKGDRGTVGPPRLDRTRKAQAVRPPTFLFPIFAIFLAWTVSVPASLAQNNAGAAANSAPRNVVAVVPRSWPPQYSVDDSGQPAGFAIDVMNEVAARADLTVTYVIAENFVVAVEVLRRGDADLIPNSGILAERMDVFSFTAPVETFVVSLFVRNKTNDIDDTADLVGRKLAVVEGNIGQLMFGERRDIQVQVYVDIRTALFQLIAGHVDALVYPQPVLLALTREIGIEDRIKVVGAPLKEVKRGIRVMKDNVELLTVLNKAVESFVGTPEYQRIYTKWYGSPTPFWTVARVTWAMGTLAFMLLIAMTWWRYRSVLKLNQDLRQTMAERKRAEEALRTREAQLRGIMDNAPIEIVLKDKKGRYVLNNLQWQKSYNLTDEEAQGKTVCDLFPEEFAKPLSAHEREVMETGKAIVREDKLPQSDGIHDFITVKFPIRDTTGELVNFGAMSIDITERKRAEVEIHKLNENLERRVEERTADLRASEALLNVIVDNAPVLFSLKDPEGRYLLTNQGHQKVVGRTLDEYRGKRPLDIFPLDHAESVMANHRRVLEMGEAVQCEEALELEDGARTYLTVKFPILDPSGKITSVGSIATDITERKRVEVALLHARDKLLRQERLTTLGKLIGTVSHELRNPLGTIRNTLMVVDAKTRDQGIGVEGALDRITRSIRRCDDIISELFDYATCRPIKRQDTSLDAWLAEVLDDLAVPEGVTVRRALGDADGRVLMDRERMRRAMINLCDNACQAMTGERDEERVDKERILTIGTEAAGNEVKIFITDTGTGMSKDTVAQIFEPLFSTKIFGVGLGLSIVKQIIERHDGTIEVMSEEGRGTRFVVRLPMVRAGSEAS